MTAPLSPNTQAILLLTAPLISGASERSTDTLTPSEYKRLARFLRDEEREPADLLTRGAEELLSRCQHVFDVDRLRRLLARGFLLSQAVDHWQARAMWVLSRADKKYPKRLKERLREDAPAVLYGCGDASILETGGLAVVGSRHVDDALVEYTLKIGELAAQASRTLVSGGARGIDQAAMRGALRGGGRVTGILSDSLERMALRREHRAPLMDGRLVLASPYDPSAGFNVGNAMQRNKLVYALSDAALVVSSDVEKGGTWAGATEQLGKLRFVPVYVRSTGEDSKGLAALRRRGAIAWPNPRTPEAFNEILTDSSRQAAIALGQSQLAFASEKPPTSEAGVHEEQNATEEVAPRQASPADALFAKVTELLAGIDTPMSDLEVAEALGVSRNQARDWLRRLVDEGVLERLSRPVRYRSAAQPSLFDGQRDVAR